MFRKAKAKTSPSEAIEAARRQINAAIDEAEKIAGPAALTELLQNLLAARRYVAAVNQPGAHVFKVSAPPSAGPVEKLLQVLRK